MESSKMKYHPASMQSSAGILAALIFCNSFLPVMATARDRMPLSAAPELTYYREQTPAQIAGTSTAEVVPKDVAVRSVAIPGGPDQPEMKSFTPMGTSDMVNPFTGDFSYNIPLMDVDGYPINLAYEAGVTMDQEASWVGLGWNLNPGVVNRVMRGLPDDFNGEDKVVKDMNLRDNFTVGVSGAVGFELFGLSDDFLEPVANESDPFSIAFKLGINYNNYNGFGAEVGITPGITLGKSNKPQYNFSLGFTGSSTGGATISPTLSRNTQNGDVTSKMSIASPFNSRAGFRNVSFGYTRKRESVTKGSVKLDADGNASRTADIVHYSQTRPFSASFNTGMSTFTPALSLAMGSGGGTFSYKFGPDLIGFDGTVEVQGYYSEQWLKEKTRSVGAYGYMNLQYGQFNRNAMLDFNRENDGAFTKNTPALPVPSLTYDIFSVSGQGMSGSYRAQRQDIGFVFDPEVVSDGANGSVGVEAGMGGTFKGGIDVSANYLNSKSGMWTNDVTHKLQFTSNTIYFREANEMSVSIDPLHFGKIGADQPVRFENPGVSSLQNILEDKNNVAITTPANYQKSGKERRNQVIYTLSYKEMYDGIGIQPLHPLAYAGQPHHIAQFTTLKNDGTRYVYGIAAYNTMQKDVSFAIDNTGSCATGRVAYSSDDASAANDNGTDHFFSATTVPAYAHAFLLTSVLGQDYMDIDAVKGPSTGDLGGYIKFGYKKIDSYKWRSPAESFQASYDEGLNTDQADDKGHYLYGEKELWYVEKIETKNHVALFYSSARKDGHGVNGESGGVSNGNPSMMKLDKIELYTMEEYLNNSSAVPIQTVHFEYDYSLCKEYSQNTDITGPQSGKLTLLKVYFTYRGSNKGSHTPYEFKYGTGDENPNYDLKSVDRWGTYKPKPACGSIESSPLRPSDFPYVGFNKANTDKWAAAWNLNEIQLPSGGKIQVDYESDDYASVQHLRANQMFRIIGVEAYDPGGNIVETTGARTLSDDDTPLKNARIYFELIPGYTNINDYIGGLTKIYFRTLMKFTDGGYDFVPGYAEINDAGMDAANSRGWIELKPAKLLDNGSADYNPIAVASIQFARIHLPRILPPSNQSVDENAEIADLGAAILGAFASYGEIFTGPNKPLWDDQIGTDLVIGNSWIRLLNPDKKKLGGGHRVKQIRLYDAWEEMTTNTSEAYYYGQDYDYTLDDNTSSGVASYEPQLGGDENPWRQPVTNDTRNLLAPDERNYQETPFGEQFFPGASVGYSRVTVKDISRAHVTRTATGKIVHEFYTAKDFPTITDRTPPQIQRFKLPVFAFFFSMCIDEMSASQGFVIENNDMHGKPRSQMVYAEGQTEPITKIEYVYQGETTTLDGVGVNRLTSNATVVQKDGTVANATLGLTYEAVADFRKSTSLNVGGTVSINGNFTVPFLLVPTLLGSGSLERTAFRSSSFTKVIERFGILESTKATDLGSSVETNTLAYDAETGASLLTQTVTDFNDQVYNFTFPAHWYYDGMGQAYKSIDVSVTLPATAYATFTSGVTTSLNKSYGFAEGDEVAYTTIGNVTAIGWVTEVNDNSIKILSKNGDPLSATIKKIKVLRSGRRNLQGTPVETITLQSNPLTNLTGNIFEQVLQSGAVEYSEEWRTFCECFTGTYATNFSKNPYVLGLKGNWRPKASYTFLSDRTQEFENNNSDIRRDGQFVSYRPFYKLHNGVWAIDKQNWTSVSSVTEFSPFGQPLETVDPLNRYAASQYGFNQTLVTAAAANARYSELGFDSFEDYGTASCIDNHFRLGMAGGTVTTVESHTGRKSIKVTSSAPALLTVNTNINCEPAACNLSAAVTTPNSTTTTVLLSGGIAPYAVEYEIMYGINSVIMNDDGDGFTISNEESSKIKMIITDAAGCVLIKEFQTIAL